MPASRHGIKVVRKVLADGSVREYRYERAKIGRPRQPHIASGIRALADAYFASPEFAALSPRWQKAMRGYAVTLEADLGWMTLDDLGAREARSDFYEMRDRHAALPARADKLVSTLRVLLAYAYDRAMIAANHAQGIKRLTRTGTRSDKIWEPEHEAALLAVAPERVREFYLFALYSLARQSDLIALRWAENWDGRWLSFQPSKTKHTTGVWVHLPVYLLDPFRALVESLPRTGPTMLVSRTGKAWTAENLKKEWRLAKAAAGLAEADRTFHDVRGTGITRMQEAGATEAETGTISGHSLARSSRAADYTKRTRAMAVHAYQKWNSAMQGDGQVIVLTQGKW